MSKMREAFERWFYASKYAQVILPTESNKQIAWDGFQAAIAAVKEVGPAAVIVHRGSNDQLDWDREGWAPLEGFTDLYKLPEDLL